MIQIFMMGRFDIYVDGQSAEECLGKSRKGKMLLEYLLMHRSEPVPYYELYEILWPNEESANPENALKTLVSRLRSMLNQFAPCLKDCIQTSRGAYRWNTSLECSIDAYEFEDIAKELERETKLTNENREAFERLFSLYGGELLPDVSSENWVIARSVALHNLYLKLVYLFIDLAEKAEDWDSIIHICRMALDIDAFDERLHLELMDALVRTKRNNDALMQYRHATNLHLRYLGVQPPEGMQEFYKRIIQADQSLDTDINSVINDLQESGDRQGAFICEYAVFKDIYHLQMRSMERLGTSMFLAMVMVSDVQGNPLEPLLLDDIMNSLLEVLQHNLRKGDTVTRYTVSQFAVLLPTNSYENGKLALDRVKSSFYKKHVNSSIMLSYRLSPIVSKKK